MCPPSIYLFLITMNSDEQSFRLHFAQSGNTTKIEDKIFVYEQFRANLKRLIKVYINMNENFIN